MTRIVHLLLTTILCGSLTRLPAMESLPVEVAEKILSFEHFTSLADALKTWRSLQRLNKDFANMLTESRLLKLAKQYVATYPKQAEKECMQAISMMNSNTSIQKYSSNAKLAELLIQAGLSVQTNLYPWPLTLVARSTSPMNPENTVQLVAAIKEQDRTSIEEILTTRKMLNELKHISSSVKSVKYEYLPASAGFVEFMPFVSYLASYEERPFVADFLEEIESVV